MPRTKALQVILIGITALGVLLAGLYALLVWGRVPQQLPAVSCL
jgi:hypothetical protein